MWTFLKKDEYQRLNHVQFITLTPFITCESTVHVAFNRTPYELVAFYLDLLYKDI